MRLGETANPGAAAFGKPLDGVRVLAAEQMQALPYATQLLARLGAEVVKVEHPVTGESGRASTPAVRDPEGRDVGATYLRNNLGKRSVGIDLKAPEGRELFLALVPHFDIVAENFKPGTMDRMGLGYDVISHHAPRAIYVSISGFGNTVETPYRDWPAYAAIVEAMSGIYEYKSGPDHPPVTIPVGALGDISSALFGVVGILAALRHRDRTGEGQYVDIAMYDAMIAMTDVVTNFWSMGVRPDPERALQVICEGFRASDGYVVLQIVREHQFFRLAELIGRPEWKDDPRFSTRAGWGPALENEIRPAIETWTGKRTKLEAANELTDAGIVAGPSNSAEDVIADKHVAARNMLVEMPRPDGVAEAVLIPGNPVKLSKMTEGPETRVPWVGEHTADVLTRELGLDDAQLEGLRDRNIIS
ncbi:MAG TPA: CaiB/BaiF CoA-transferase family protein [Acidimicrobiia bacterium]|jgi:formyl-CoA transferase|nr:CaiB/BaiF CoA-transferase family protein [Acidimicrobiia bacterium]